MGLGRAWEGISDVANKNNPRAEETTSGRMRKRVEWGFGKEDDLMKDDESTIDNSWYFPLLLNPEKKWKKEKSRSRWGRVGVGE